MNHSTDQAKDRKQATAAIGHMPLKKNGAGISLEDNRPKPVLQKKAKVNVNDDQSLEKEADLMGSRALSNTGTSARSTIVNESGASVSRSIKTGEGVAQLVRISDWMGANATADFVTKHVAYSREPGRLKAITGRSGLVSTATVLILTNTEQRDIFRNLGPLAAHTDYHLADVHMVKAGSMNWERGFGR